MVFQNFAGDMPPVQAIDEYQAIIFGINCKPGGNGCRCAHFAIGLQHLLGSGQAVHAKTFQFNVNINPSDAFHLPVLQQYGLVVEEEHATQRVMLLGRLC